MAAMPRMCECYLKMYYKYWRSYSGLKKVSRHVSFEKTIVSLYQGDAVGWETANHISLCGEFWFRSCSPGHPCCHSAEWTHPQQGECDLKSFWGGQIWIEIQLVHLQDCTSYLPISLGALICLMGKRAHALQYLCEDAIEGQVLSTISMLDFWRFYEVWRLWD